MDIIFTGSDSRDICRIGPSDTFAFKCHKKIRCFTECCRLLELVLTPYDCLRLRKATGLTSEQLLEKYLIIEQDVGEPFPRLYLTMVDDGRASCVFVSAEGCSVYNHRPGACRIYPLGRAVSRTANGIREEFVLLHEKHCFGFLEATRYSPRSYLADQDLELYNRYNDLFLEILQHQAIRDGMIPSRRDIDFFLLALYNIDTFRKTLFHSNIDGIDASNDERLFLQDDEKLLEFAICQVNKRLFGATKWHM